MYCDQCRQFSSRKDVKKANGKCPTCSHLDAEKRDRLHDLYSCFGHGRMGFYQWLKFGKFLDPITDEAERFWHNDRVQVIQSMIGTEKMDHLLKKLVQVIIDIAKEKIESV